MVSSINADSVKEYIHGLAETTGCTKRKERLELLDQIAEKGQEILNDLNTTNQSVCELMDDIDSIYDEMTKWQEDVEVAEKEVEDSQKSLSQLYEELDPLNRKDANGTLTDTEKIRLKELRSLVASKEQESAEDNYTLNSLGNGSTYTGTLSGDFAMLEELTADMAGYAEAGEEIKNSASTYGKKNMNCEKALDRNEKSWIAAATGLGDIGNGGKAAATTVGVTAAGTLLGTSAYSAACAGIGAAAAGATSGVVAGAAIAGAVGLMATPVGWAVAGVGAIAGAGVIINNTAYNKFNTYLDRMNYTEVGDNSQTFYDNVDNEYVAEYDVIEGKGGNQIYGKMRKATAKVYSYGKTITTAANEIENKADNAINTKKTTGQAESK